MDYIQVFRAKFFKLQESLFKIYNVRTVVPSQWWKDLRQCRILLMQRNIPVKILTAVSQIFQKRVLMYPVPATMFNFLVVVERNKSVSRYSNCRSRYGDIYKDKLFRAFSRGSNLTKIQQCSDQRLQYWTLMDLGLQQGYEQTMSDQHPHFIKLKHYKRCNKVAFEVQCENYYGEVSYRS